MDIRSKNYSHSLITKIVTFIIAILCFTGAITVSLNIATFHIRDFDSAFEENYFRSKEYLRETSKIIDTVRTLITEYKSEEYILSGGTITEEEISAEKENLFSDFKYGGDRPNHNKGYNSALSQAENYKKFEEVYADEISQIKDNLIADDLKWYNSNIRWLEEYEDVFYYGSDGKNVFTNSTSSNKDFFKSYPSYLIFDYSEETSFPNDIRENRYYFMYNIGQLQEQGNAVYVAFTDEFLKLRIDEWQRNKTFITNSIYMTIGLLLGLAVSFIYLLVIIGRKYFGEKEVHLNFVDRLYNDFKIVLCFMLIGLWFVLMNFIAFENRIAQAIFPITLFIGSLGLILVLSLVKQIKNGTIIKNSLVYAIFHRLFTFIRDIFNSGSIAVKVVLIVIGYPIIVAMTFFIFPITIGAAVWLAFKKVKAYKAIKEGVEIVKGGDIHHKIEIPGSGEFAKLAIDINSITEGLNKAVANELKSERLKTELITNVSHDIRTPLTSIITYVDLLKNEEDPKKTKEYIKIIEQKSERLKTLTDDLFEASKASSGNIPVNYEKIDIVSLITQGLGEVDDKIQNKNLEFKVTYPNEKVYINADGKLLWRAIENLLSNIFKYALEGSRVYVNIDVLKSEVKLVIKNISAYELNISSEELMERFKRGDESRTSQGSGLGLSIAKSLIEIQNGSFNIEIDGDLFKAIIKMPK